MASKPKPRPARKRGRQSTYTDAMARRVLVFFREGGTRHGLEAQPGLPSWTTFQRWMQARQDLRYQYARALEDQAHALFEEAVQAARTATRENVHVARLKADVLLRAAGQRRPKVYSERVIAEEIAASHRIAALERRAGLDQQDDADATPVQRPFEYVITGKQEHAEPGTG